MSWSTMGEVRASLRRIAAYDPTLGEAEILRTLNDYAVKYGKLAELHDAVQARKEKLNDQH